MSKTKEEIIERIRNGFVFLKFTNTRGSGTEVGINIINSNLEELRNDNVIELIIEGKTKLNFHLLNLFRVHDGCFQIILKIINFWKGIFEEKKPDIEKCEPNNKKCSNTHKSTN